MHYLYANVFYCDYSLIHHHYSYDAELPKRAALDLQHHVCSITNFAFVFVLALALLSY
jgi:hypothetical protein